MVRVTNMQGIAARALVGSLEGEDREYGTFN